MAAGDAIIYIYICQVVLLAWVRFEGL